MTGKVLTLFAIACWAAAAAPSVAAEKEPETGQRLYLKHCASCHGVDGRGGTELAKLFEKEPPDLTRIAIRHGGSWFAEVLVTEIVDGRFAAHGGREMPVWGEVLTRDQIILVTEYLHGIQQTPGR